MEFLNGFKEISEFGFNITIISATMTLFFTLVQGWGLLKQNGKIWSEKSGASFSVIMSSYFLFKFAEFSAYGFFSKSLAMVFNSLLFILLIPILVGLYRYKGFRKIDWACIGVFSLMPVIMVFYPEKDYLELFFLGGVLAAIIAQTVEFAIKGKTGAVEPKFLFVFTITNVAWFIYALSVGNWVFIIFAPTVTLLFGLNLILWRVFRKRELEAIKLNKLRDMYLTRYEDLVTAVRKDHNELHMTCKGHDFFHALRVASYCVLVAEDYGKKAGELAFVAAIMHNTDRIYGEKAKEKLDEYISLIPVEHEEYMSLVPGLSKIESDIVLDAIEKHGKRDSESDWDNIILVILKDADKLANIAPDFLIRSAQHFSGIPALDPFNNFDSETGVIKRHPQSVYNNAFTVVDDVFSCLEWRTWMRTPKGKELSKKYFDFLESIPGMMGTQLHELGLFGNDYPFPEDFREAYERLGRIKK